MSRRKLLITAAGLAAVAAGWAASGVSTPPIYDSGLPPPPFRPFCNPAASETRASGHTESDPVAAGQVPSLEVSTDEPVTPQAQLLSAPGAFVLPPGGAAAVTADIEPVQPPAALPTDGRIDGNVYRFSVTAGDRVLAIGQGQLVSVVLRGADSSGNATQRTVERYDGGRWKRLQTNPIGVYDIWSANVDALGAFALVAPGAPATPQPCSAASSPPPPGSGGGGSGILIGAVLGAVVLAAAAGLLALRRGGRGGSPPAATGRPRPTAPGRRGGGAAPPPSRRGSPPARGRDGPRPTSRRRG